MVLLFKFWYILWKIFDTIIMFCNPIAVFKGVNIPLFRYNKDSLISIYLTSVRWLLTNIITRKNDELKDENQSKTHHSIYYWLWLLLLYYILLIMILWFPFKWIVKLTDRLILLFLFSIFFFYFFVRFHWLNIRKFL